MVFYGFYALPRDQWIKIVLLPFIFFLSMAFPIGAIISLIRQPFAMISTDEVMQGTFPLSFNGIKGG